MKISKYAVYAVRFVHSIHPQTNCSRPLKLNWYHVTFAYIICNISSAYLHVNRPINIQKYGKKKYWNCFPLQFQQVIFFLLIMSSIQRHLLFYNIYIELVENKTKKINKHEIFTYNIYTYTASHTKIKMNYKNIILSQIFIINNRTKNCVIKLNDVEWLMKI